MAGAWLGHLTYRTDLFEPGTARRLAESFVHLLAQGRGRRPTRRSAPWRSSRPAGAGRCSRPAEVRNRWVRSTPEPTSSSNARPGSPRRPSRSPSAPSG
ncbi:hypothetical protein [Streptosporangium vulgare]|uniref:hypothetical protein n=1 Tax=Streptosporangium vulgare TaxID=46190 RepID=UPI0031E0D7FC